MDVVECQELTKFYGNLKALNKLSFKLQEDKITGLIGRNGAGKTSLLRVIAGFMAKSSGEIKVFSDNPFNNVLVSANTIYINDNMPFPLSLNLSQILDCTGMFYKNWDGGLAKRLLEHFSLNPKQYYRNLSKGMKGTFNVIVGMSAHCALTIYDEPITGMDSAVRKDFYRALLRDYIEHPRTIIMSSHHLDEIQDVMKLLKKSSELQLENTCKIL